LAEPLQPRRKPNGLDRIRLAGDERVRRDRDYGRAYVYTVPATPGTYNVAPVDGEILLSQSSDGYNWGPAIKTGHFTRAAPILRYIDGRLLLMFLGKDPSDPSIFACTSSDGVSWAEHEICPGVAPPAFGGFDFPPYFEAPVLKG
jgi:hypothetical protein